MSKSKSRYGRECGSWDRDVLDIGLFCDSGEAEDEEEADAEESEAIA